MPNKRSHLNRLRPANSVGNNTSDITSPLNAGGTSTIAAPGQGITPGTGAAAQAQFTLNGGAVAYVANSGTNTVSVIDLATFYKIKDIIVGNGPVAMDISPNGNYIYVVSRVGTLTLFTTGDNIVTGTINLPGSPTGVKVSSTGEFIYVVYDDNPIVSIINAVTEQLVGSISLPDFGYGIDLTQDGRYAYVTLKRSNQVAVVDLIANLVVKHLYHVPCPENITIWRSASLAFVSDTRANAVSVLNTDLAVAAPETIPAFRRPAGIAVGPTLGRVYVALSGSDEVMVIDLSNATILPRIDINQRMPEGLALTSDEGFLLVANSGSGSLSLVNLTTNQVEASIATGVGASYVLIFEPQRIGSTNMQ